MKLVLPNLKRWVVQPLRSSSHSNPNSGFSKYSLTWALFGPTVLFCSTSQFQMGSIDTIKPLPSTALSSSPVNKPWSHRKNIWEHQESLPGRLGVKRRHALCAMPYPRYHYQECIGSEFNKNIAVALCCDLRQLVTFHHQNQNDLSKKSQVPVNFCQ